MIPHRPQFWLAVLLTVAASNSAQAQVLSSELLGGAALGGLIGGIVGHNSNRHTAEGIGIGAASGALLGALKRNRDHYDTYIPSRSQSRYADTPFGLHRPHHAITGAAVGAVAGGIIGHNSGRHTLEGVGIGAAGGMVIGAVTEQVQRRHATQHYFAEEAPPRHSPAFHANAPTAKPSAFPTAILSQAIRDDAIITTSSPSLKTGSTLIEVLPDHTGSAKPPVRRPSSSVRFEYLGNAPRK
jgi:uncharacterized protein YcfJ